MDHNVPLDVAFQLDEIQRAAWCIIFSEQNGGGKFNFDRMDFDREQP